MGICQQKWLITTTLGIVFSLSSVVNAKAATVSYEVDLNGNSNPGELSNVAPFDLANSPLIGTQGFVTLGYGFSVMPDPTDINLEMTAFGVFAPPNATIINDATNDVANFPDPPPDGPRPFFVLPEADAEQNLVYFPDTVHEIGLWEVDINGENPNLLRRITINPEDPENPGNPNPLLGFVDGFAYLSLDDPDDPVTPDDPLDDIFTLDGNTTQYFRLGITYIDDSDQAWINNSVPLAGDVVIPNANLDGVPNEGAAVDPMLILDPNIDGNDYPQGYYGVPSDPTTDPLAFPDQESLGFFFGTNPFFVTGNILFGPLPPEFPIASTTTGGTTTGGTTTGGTTTGGTTTGGTTTGGTTTGGTTTGGTTTGGTTTGGTTTGGTTTGGTTTGGTTTGGVPTIPEPSLIHGLLAIALGSIVTRYRQGKAKK